MKQDEARLTTSEKLETFKFYEAAAEKSKAHAWTQTTWILSLNTGILAFSLNFYAEHSTNPAFLLIELISAGVGVVLSGFLMYVLNELGSHISNYWTSSNKIAAGYAPLVPFVGEDTAAKATEKGYHAEFPQFCRRLQYLAGLFIAAHIGWALIVALKLAA